MKIQTAKSFFDKTITRNSVTTVTDDEGWSRGGATKVVIGTYKGNPRFTKLEELQKQFGIHEDISIAITCSSDEDIVLGEIHTYNNQDYRIVSVLPFDSHKLIVGQIWLSRSSISPSV